MPCNGQTVDIAGTVVSINKKLWCFSLEDGRMIYMPHLAAFNESALLPSVGSCVCVQNAHFEPVRVYFVHREPKIFYLCANSVIDSTLSENVPKQRSTLLKLINQNYLRIGDFKQLLDTIKSGILPVETEEFAFEVYKTIVETKGDNFKDTTLSVVSRCVFVNSKIELCPGMPYWSFGCHPSKEKEVLVGYLRLIHQYGFLILSDCYHKIVCIIKTKDKKSLLNFTDKYVLITKYIVFTEVFCDYTKGIDYLFCDIKDLNVINFDVEAPKINLKDKEADFKPTEMSQLILLLKKSTPMLTFQNKPQFWLEVQPLDGDENEKFCLSLGEPHLHLFQFLQVGCVYRLFHNKCLQQMSDCEMRRVLPNCVCFKVDDASAFFVLEKEGSERDVLNVEDALTEIKTSVDLISFQGVVREREFLKPLSSRTERKVKVLAYGTPGAKTHLLVFESDNYKKNVLKLYLNNWESIQMPFGLLPGMRILVRNVLPQRKAYCKSTILTSFEVLNYEPKVMFETANLRTEDGFDGHWGNPFNLGCGYLIPNGVLVYSQIQTVKIRSLKLSYGPDKSNTHNTLQVTMTMITTDSGGRAMVICKSAEVLRVLLEIPKSQWGDFCESVRTIKEYRYDKYFFENHAVELYDFSTALTAALDLISEISMTDVEFLCRKLYSKMEDNDRLPLWLCINARKK